MNIFFGITFIVAGALAGAPAYDDHHHHGHHDSHHHQGHHDSHHHQGHHDSHHHHHAGYSPAAFVAKSPVLVSKGATALAGVPLYSHAHGHAYDNNHIHGYHGHHHHSHYPAAYSVPTSEHVALLSTAGKPQLYSKSVPAAAIRNIETVKVVKTITPVVTKTITHHTHAEPALSLGHVQGYSQNAVGHAKVAPVQFNTQYTTYSNPTVGINGPVVYAGPAIGYASGAVVTKAATLAAVAPQPVLKTAIAASPAYYAVHPGSALSLGYYGYDAHSIPVANFLDLKHGKPVFASPSVAYAVKK